MGRASRHCRFLQLWADGKRVSKNSPEDNNLSEAVVPITAPELDGWTWSLTCERDDAFLLSDILSELGAPLATAVSIDELSPRSFRVTAYYLAKPDANEITTAIELVGVEKSILSGAQISPIAKTNWVARSQENLNPVEAGRFCIFGEHDRDRIKHRSRTTIEINAAEAFGTAHHGTTKGCLLAINAYMRRAYPPRRILDLGTGTGVLAIACALLSPHALITATDIDPIATRTAATNCRLNAVGNRIDILDCPGFEHPKLRKSKPFDLIIANILADPLKSMSGQFFDHTKPGGTLILSGILNTQSDAVANTFRAHGFIHKARLISGEWSTLTMQRCI